VNACHAEPNGPLQNNDVVVVTQKIVSKAEGRLVEIDPENPLKMKGRSGYFLINSKALVSLSAEELIDTSPRSNSISPPLIAPPKIMIPLISPSDSLAKSVFEILFSRGLINTSEAGSHPTTSKSSKASNKNLLHKSGFLKPKKSRLNKTKIITQFKGSIQNCTTFERIKKIVSIIAIDLNLSRPHYSSTSPQLALI
jgi:hypothetical protein